MPLGLVLALVAPLWLGAFFSSYAWTPADLFVHAAFLPPIIFVRTRKSAEAAD
jgi:hypothetical protein